MTSSSSTSLPSPQQQGTAPSHPPAAAAKLSCCCQQTKISFAALPIKRLECCCVDCRKGIDWCIEQQQKQQQQNTQSTVTSSVISDLVYFPNLLQVTTGKELLKAYKIKENYNTLRIVATCCWTPLLGDHPFYQQQYFVTYHPTSNLTIGRHDTMKTLPPASRRIFVDDLTPSEMTLLPPFDLDKQQSSSSSSFPSSPDLQELQNQYPDYESLQSLIESLDEGHIHYMDPSYQGPPTEWNKAMAAYAASANQSK